MPRLLFILIAALLCGVSRADLSVPALNSLPGATNTLYLDFHGEPAQSWAGESIPATPAFDEDGDPTTFTAQELADITAIYGIVATAYAPWALNVTTVDPGGWNVWQPHRARVIIGGTNSWAPGLGGIAYVGGFSNSVLPQTAFVFSASMGNVPMYVGGDSAHEAGHLFGLQHQSVWSNGVLVNEYAPGVYMGIPWPDPQWTTGLTDTGAFQDDRAVLTSVLSLAPVPEPSLAVLAVPLLMIRNRVP